MREISFLYDFLLKFKVSSFDDSMNLMNPKVNHVMNDVMFAKVQCGSLVLSSLLQQCERNQLSLRLFAQV